MHELLINHATVQDGSHLERIAVAFIIVSTFCIK